MDMFNKSQILKLFLMAILLSITPLLSTPLRPPYLYFVVNILIIALGVEAGLLSFIGKTAEDKKTASNIVLSSEDSPASNKEKLPNTTSEAETTAKKKPKAVEKSPSEKIVTAAKVHKVVKKSPSMPSLFFIGGAESSTIDQVEEFIEEEDFDDDDDDDDGKQEAALGDEISGQELFHKAETFIGNFYKQLKMQREDSWKKIHGFYQKAF